MTEAAAAAEGKNAADGRVCWSGRYQLPWCLGHSVQAVFLGSFDLVEKDWRRHCCFLDIMQQLGVWCALVAHSVTFFKLHR